MTQLIIEPKVTFALVNPVKRQGVSGEFSRYLVISAVALAVDVGVLTLFSGVFGIHYLIANPLAFALGALTAYLGSIHWAFRNRKLSNKGLELAIFVAIGVGGLAVNEAVLWLGIEVVTLSLLMAKMGAAVASFAFNFVVRKMVLFTA